ncbi:MAG: hypothetical protein GPJ54_18980 [Candidatus Heimdallarchaeota archaeon]|nr:hypothetical protein [Candidatus Heimdallarchaeota archaeon]
MSAPVYSNDCDIWIHKDAFCLEFKMKIGDGEDVVARVLMSPDSFMGLAEIIEGVMEGLEGARIIPEDEGYEGVEFS